MQDMQDIIAALTDGLHAHGMDLGADEIDALTTPRRLYNAQQIGTYKKRIAPNWLVLREVLRRTSQELDAREWMDRVERVEDADVTPMVTLAREALYNNPRWPDGTPRKDHPGLAAAAVIVFWASVALCFYSIILRRPALFAAGVALFIVLQAPLHAARLRAQRADRAETDRLSLV